MDLGNLNIDELLENDLIKSMMNGDFEKKKLDIYIESFKQGNFDFIVKGIANNSEGDWEKGKLAKNVKQEESLKALTSNEYDLIFYGGGAGSGKSFMGMCWILFSALAYPDTKYFIARKELKSIKGSVLSTFSEVCTKFGITNFKYNAVDNVISFPNKSVINLIEVAYKPSDPEYTIVGSTLYTSGWFEEVGEIPEKAVSILQTRVNRWNVDKYDLTGVVFLTGNPSKNWTKREFYDKSINGELEMDNLDPNSYNKKYINCLVVENPFMTEKYIRSLKLKAKTDKTAYEVLYKGNWDYENNPYQLAEQEMIESVFDNDHLEGGKTYLTADIARYGSDKAVIVAWDGWIAKEIRVYDKSSLQDLVHDVNYLRRKYRIPKTRCIGDSDGVGGFAIDATGIKPFVNGARAIKVNKETPNYRNLQVQCLYMLADKINEGGLWISCDKLTPKEKEYILQELAQIQSAPNKRDSEKLDCKTKAEIKQDINRSPDYRDALLMRMFFDLKKENKRIVVKWT